MVAGSARPAGGRRVRRSRAVERFTLVTTTLGSTPTRPTRGLRRCSPPTGRPACARGASCWGAGVVEAAAAAGAQRSPGCRGHPDLLRDDSGRVIGVRTDLGDVTASLVIGADGRSSTVARLAGARSYHTYRAGECPRGATSTASSIRSGGCASASAPVSRSSPARPTRGSTWPVWRPRRPTRPGSSPTANRTRRAAPALAELADLLAARGGSGRFGPCPTWAVTSASRPARAGCSPATPGTSRIRRPRRASPTRSSRPSDSRRHRRATLRPRLPRRRVARLVALARPRLLRHALVRPRHGPRRATPPLTAEFLRGVAADPVAGAQLLQVLNREITPNDWMTAGRIIRAAAG